MLKRISLLLVLSVIAGPWAQAACLNEFNLTHPDYRYTNGSGVSADQSAANFDEVESAAGSSNAISVETLSGIIGVSGVFASNQAAYQAAIEDEIAGINDVAALQALIDAVNASATISDEVPVVAVNEAIVIDLETGLEWSRCPIGFTYSSNTCVASVNSSDYNLNWAEAHAQAQIYDSNGTGWRVPNVKELQSLIAATCTSRAINALWFPNAGNGDFWTSTPDAKQPDQVWKINLNTGYSSVLNKNVDRRVYLVR